MTNNKALPIDKILPDVIKTLTGENRLVLTALPGSGKTTRIPLALLNEPWLDGKKIIMLEPRRLAAKSAAIYMAGLIGEQVGQTVGYRMRQDTKVSNLTRLEIMTEGVLTRLLESDAALLDVGLVIFDEFHERSIHADLGLALMLELQELIREDLRILVMSATMDTEKVALLLGGAPIVEGSGLIYPVETIHLTARPEADFCETVVKAIYKAIHEETGDILVFLPGAGEIQQVQAMLKNSRCTSNVLPLYGALPVVEQERALSKAKPGERKVVLATAIAETSLTVEGVRVVIDGGLMRVPRYFPQTGLTRLETVKVTIASANQRRGRAGRLGPGVCYRLWTKQDELRFKEQNTPEILEADLLFLVLELKVWGINEPSELKWLDAPSSKAFTEAVEILKKIGAIDASGKVTVHGRNMAALSLEPRLANMVLKAKEIGCGILACDLAALLEERDILLNKGQADLRIRLEALCEMRLNNYIAADFDQRALQRVLLNSKRYQEMLDLKPCSYDIDAAGLVLSFAYFDRIAQGKGSGRFLLRSGKGAVLKAKESISEEDYLVIAELHDKGSVNYATLAAPIREIELKQYFSKEVQSENIIWWDMESHMVRALCREKLDEIVFREVILNQPPPDEVLRALLEGIRAEGLNILPWHKADRQLQQRMAFLHSLDKSWPDVSDEKLIGSLEEWLMPYIIGIKRKTELQQLVLEKILLGMLYWEQQQKLPKYAPTHIVVPSGQRILIDYTNPTNPVLAVRLQEMFGLTETPRIAGGSVPLTLHLLSPAMRPVQVTKDLQGFWQNAYYAVKKDLAGRYPRHYWPDNPLEAAPTNRVKPRK